MTTHHQTRYTLLNRALDCGDNEAWEELTRHYQRFIYFVLHRLNIATDDLDDITQQVLIKLLEFLPKYDRSKAKFRSWLGSIIHNTAVSYIRKQASQQKRIDGLRVEQTDTLYSKPAEVEAVIESEWASYIANIAMERVTKLFQGQAIEVFKLGLEGFKPTEIAEKTGLNIHSVYTLRNRVKKRIYLEVLELRTDLEP